MRFVPSSHPRAWTKLGQAEAAHLAKSSTYRTSGLSFGQTGSKVSVLIVSVVAEFHFN